MTEECITPLRRRIIEPTRVGHLSRGPLPHALGVTITPDAGGDDVVMPLIDQVAHALPDQVIGDRPAAQPVLVQQRMPLAR